MTTSLQAGKSISVCVCNSGFYGPPASEAGLSTCKRCGILLTSDRGAHVAGDCYLSSNGQVLVASCVFLLVGGIGFLLFARYMRHRYTALQEQRLMQQMTLGLKAVKSLAHPMVLISATDFCSMPMESLKTLHEGCRNAGYLITLDTLETIDAFKGEERLILFFSYQWLSWTSPGPNTVQHLCMVSAVKNLCAEAGLKQDKVYIWLDILSIPQRNASQKMAAVNSLYTYAGQADYLVIIAPESEHEDLQFPAGADTYKQRVWCRAEQMAFFCFKGYSDMFLATADSFARVPDTWIHDVACIFDGDMTCCTRLHEGHAACDKLSLVAPLSGMYFDLYTKHMCGQLSSDASVVWNFISRNQEKVFPTSYQHVTAAGTVSKELFGKLIGRVQAFVAKDLEQAFQMSTATSEQPKGMVSAHDNYTLIVPTEAPRRKSMTRRPIAKPMESKPIEVYFEDEYTEDDTVSI
eukprot:TRINITY_DN1469_c0_g1_i6.p1 TRINITY_DN1469_c0_g1~~TRINITY_DN1469_c0_g1_i6.p1  ORF type:complete len:464 (-),score=55.16 TRINITY_DN1469_c0_g1_i6:289-1680(-)